MSSSLAWNERVNTVKDMAKNTDRLLAVMSDSNPLRLSWNLATQKKKRRLLLYSLLYKNTHTYIIPGNSSAMSVDEASPSNNTLLINCVRL